MDLLHASLALLLSLSLVFGGVEEEYSQIQQQIEKISRDLEVEHHFNRVESQVGLQSTRTKLLYLLLKILDKR